MPAPRKGSLITIFVPKPHSSHVFGPHTILGLSGSDLISLQFGHFLYFLAENWASQKQLAILEFWRLCAVCSCWKYIDKILLNIWEATGSYLTSTQFRPAGTCFDIHWCSDCFYFLPVLSDWYFPPYHHQIYALRQIFTSFVFSNILPPAARCSATQAGSHLLRYPLQHHKPNVCPIKSI